MNKPLAEDRQGNRLTAFFPPSTAPLDAPMPAALAAVWHARHLLLVFDRHRGQWELPGGLIDPGETPWQAAVRELHEESGLHLPTLALAGYGHFHLTDPPRDEYAALYTARVTARHSAFVPNEEISAIRWWDSATPTPHDAQVLDTTLALHIR
ncbi:NUDIX hydrolase [Actinomadura sp. KC216]|uniref:NUDIX hydrolase n=1 Tax=Actinomadura sp. KC216 TaxID=2530370 RepID=UPI001051F15D|nr:NUDIX hydrolase [Actinomadura sp. KC216]TDB77388.1 NUDIX hydrolase [Actinomadura sp. KC216]